jgi:hypothetical protein|tara:strand:+ start:1914 stop:2438 length:525 start_codon:yes stop_codon:yes gene_type:complete
MNPSLTSFVSWPTKKNALMLDQVPASEDPEAGPFLITASKGVLWVERAFPGGFLRVATQHTEPETLFRLMVEAVAARGGESEWGNVDTATHKGMSQGISHLHYYGFKDLECLCGKGFKPKDVVGIPATTVDWLPDGWGVLLPKDRSYVGTVYDLGEGTLGGVLHNASRGVVVLN